MADAYGQGKLNELHYNLLKEKISEVNDNQILLQPNVICMYGKWGFEHRKVKVRNSQISKYCTPTVI